MYLPSAGLLLAAVGLVAPPVREVPRPRDGHGGRLCSPPLSCVGSATVARISSGATTTPSSTTWSRSAPGRPRRTTTLRMTPDGAAKRPSNGATSRPPSRSSALLRRLGLPGADRVEREAVDDALAGYRRAVDVHRRTKTASGAREGPGGIRTGAGGRARLGRGRPARSRFLSRRYHRAAFFDSRGRVDEAVAEWHRAVLAGTARRTAPRARRGARRREVPGTARPRGKKRGALSWPIRRMPRRGDS